MKKLILLFLFSSPVFAVQNSWIPKWLDSPAPAIYERTPTAMRTYVDMPKYGGSVEWTLNSTPPTNAGNTHYSAASTATTPKIATNVKIPLGASAGVAASAVLTAVVPKAALAKASMALLRGATAANPYVATALTAAWLVNAGFEYFTDTDTFKAQVMTGNYSSAGYTTTSMALLTAHFNDAANTFTDGGLNPSLNSYCGGLGGVLLNNGAENRIYCITNSSYQQQLVTPSAVETKLSNSPVSGTADTASSLDGVLNEALKGGYNPDTDGLTPSLTGAATTQGQSTSVVNPDNSVSTNNIVYNNTYTNNYVDTTQTTTTVNTPSSGAPVTTSVTVPADIPLTSTTPATTQTTNKTDCEIFPASLGCAEFGDVPTPDLITTTNVPISLDIGAYSSGSCPAPQVLNLSFGVEELSYQPLCNFASNTKPLFIALAFLSAGLLVLAPIRS